MFGSQDTRADKICGFAGRGEGPIARVVARVGKRVDDSEREFAVEC